MSKQIKAIIFDYGNVLCELQQPGDIDAMAGVLEQAQEQFTGIYWRCRATYDRADMSAEEYWNRVAQQTLDADRVQKLVALDNRSWMHPREVTLPWVERARQDGLKTALLSNLPVSLMLALEQDCPWLPRFDVRTYSCAVRKAKPQPEIYEQCLRDLGMAPGESVFLDDRPENVQGAVEVGLNAVLFEGADAAAQELEKRFGVSVQG